jgi:hypothetical protein
MESKLKLDQGDKLNKTNHRTKGSWQETDIYSYDILNKNGATIGTVVHTDHTAIKGFGRTQSVKQTDMSGKVIVDLSWSGD